MSQPLNPSDNPIPAEKITAYAPPKAMPPRPPATTPLQGDNGKQVARQSLMAFAPAPERARPQEIPSTEKPIGECPHKLPWRWADDALDLEGCLRCGLANIRGRWEHNEEWVASAQKAGKMIG